MEEGGILGQEKEWRATCGNLADFCWDIPVGVNIFKQHLLPLWSLILGKERRGMEKYCSGGLADEEGDLSSDC